MRSLGAAGKGLKLLITGTALLIFSGCIVQSLYPYYTKESLCEIAGLEGEWRLLDDKGKPQASAPWIFRDNTIEIKDDGTISWAIRFKSFRVGDSFFLDTAADEPAREMSKWWTMHVFPAHVVTKVEVIENRLVLTPIDYGWLDRALKNGQVALPHIRLKDEDAVLFTATSEEWVAFLKKYGQDKQVFSPENTISFLKETANRKDGR